MGKVWESGSGYLKEVSQKLRASIVDKKRWEILSRPAGKEHGGCRVQVSAVAIAHSGGTGRSCAQTLD